MKVRSIFLLVAVIAPICFARNSVEADSKEVARLEAATEVLREIMAIPEKGIPPVLLHNAYGVAVIPRVIKAGFVVGGRYGRGIVVVRDEEDKWSNPSFIILYGGSIGFQIGGQSTDFILVFRDNKAIDSITNGTFTLGADASVAAGPVGRHVEVGTDRHLKSEIYSYSRSRGLFAGVGLGGANLEIDDNANAAFYGEEGITPGDIFRTKGMQVPAVANKFKQVLTKYTTTATKN
jgi:lipid-binding SYLF domain-containing protein